MGKHIRHDVVAVELVVNYAAKLRIKYCRMLNMVAAHAFPAICHYAAYELLPKDYLNTKKNERETVLI